MGRWEDRCANLVPRLGAGGHAGESAGCWGTGFHHRGWGSTYRNPRLLVLRAGRGRSRDLSGLGEGRIWQWDILRVKFMERERCRPREDGETEALRQFATLSSGAGRGSRQRGPRDEGNCGDVTLCALCAADRRRLESAEVVTEPPNPAGHCPATSTLPSRHAHTTCAPGSSLSADLLVSADGCRGAAAAQTPSGWTPGMGAS